jgi:hypothetical protein
MASIPLSPAREVLTARSLEAIAHISRLIDRLNDVRKEIEGTLRDYNSQEIPEPRTEIRLISVIDFCKSRRRMLEYLLGVNVPPDDPIDTEGLRFRYLIDGRWKAHELSRMLSATNQIFQVVAVSIVKAERPLRGSAPASTRLDVFVDANLHYFMTRNEDLRVLRVRYGSPGEVELTSHLLQHFPHAASLLILILSLARLTPWAIEQWAGAIRRIYEERFRIRDLKRQEWLNDAMYQARRALALKMLEELPKLVEEDRHPSDESSRRAARELVAAIEQIMDAEIVDGPELVKRTAGDLVSIARLVRSERRGLHRTNAGPI